MPHSWGFMTAAVPLAVKTSSSLEQALFDLISEFPPTDAQVRMVVTGKSKGLDPAIREQLYMITREALTNAFRHSDATIIEVEVEYRSRRMRVVVRDNGCGMDPQVVKSGRNSHWGLVGMHERARTFGARLCLRSRRGLGTEAEVSLALDSASDAIA